VDNIIKVFVPRENVNDQYVTILNWYFESGQKVFKGDEVVELETTKAAFSVESPDDGLIYFKAKAGDDLKTGELLFFLSDSEIPSEQLALIFEETGRTGKTTADISESLEIYTDKISKSDYAEIESHTPTSRPAGVVRFSQKAMELIKHAHLDTELFNGRGLVREKDVREYLNKNNKDIKHKAAAERIGPEEIWVDHDNAPVPKGKGLYSKEYIERIISGAYGGGEISNNRRILAGTLWICHFLAAGIIWVLVEIPIINSWIEILARIYKRNIFGFFLRGAYYKAKLKYMGLNVIIDQGVEIWGANNVSIGTGCHLDINARIAAGEQSQGQHGSIEIGDYVHIGPQTHLAGRGGIKIGSYTAITAGTKIFSASNVGDNPDDPTDLVPMSHVAPLKRQQIFEAPVVIEDHVFVGLNVCILPGVKIGRGSIINSGAVITKDVPPFSIVKGAGMSIAGKRMPKEKH